MKKALLYEKLQEEIEKEATKKKNRKKRRKKMKVSGKSVFNLQKIIIKKNKKP